MQCLIQNWSHPGPEEDVRGTVNKTCGFPLPGSDNCGKGMLDINIWGRGVKGKQEFFAPFCNFLCLELFQMEIFFFKEHSPRAS